MGWKRSEAFVLRTTAIGESDRIVTLLTRDWGKIRAVAKNARRSRRRFGGGLELLTRVQADWFEREGADLGRLEGCEIQESYFGLLEESLEASFLLHYFAELAECFSREHEPEPRFYRLLASCLAAAREGADRACLARYFEFWSLRLHGMLADLDRCSGCGRRPGEGTVILPITGRELLCSGCAGRDRGGIRLRRRDGEWIRRLWRLGPVEMCRDGERPGEELARFTRREIEAYLERPLRSRRFLQESLARAGAPPPPPRGE